MLEALYILLVLLWAITAAAHLYISFGGGILGLIAALIAVGVVFSIGYYLW